MFGAAPYLYIGKKRLKVELDYKDIDITEPIEELLGLADESQSQMVNGAIERLEKLNKEVTPETINRMIQKDSSKIVSVFISIH
jgi:formate dehydrogenase maturation protein FdhE